jgi:hypothetical protein
MRMRAKPLREVTRAVSSLVGTSFMVGLFATGASASRPGGVDIDPTSGVSIRSTSSSSLRPGRGPPRPPVASGPSRRRPSASLRSGGPCGAFAPQDMLAFAMKVQPSLGGRHKPDEPPRRRLGRTARAASRRSSCTPRRTMLASANGTLTAVVLKRVRARRLEQAARASTGGHSRAQPTAQAGQGPVRPHD